jgi:hypothetical protein
MNALLRSPWKCQGALPFLLILSIHFLISFLPFQVSAQKPANLELQKMPEDLETDFALSSLPSHLRANATVYLLDPSKGYYLARRGENGFVCFVTRTEWEWGEFRTDLTMPISFDPEGAKTIFPVYQDVAAMRASGKFTALQIKDSVINRIKRGIYRAPARPGVSYMLSPLMRGYPGMPSDNQIMTMSMPHYMFYAPYMGDADIGGTPQGPFVNNPGNTILGEGKGPFGYIILPAGEAERAKIVKDEGALLHRLAEYKSYYELEPGGSHHQ